MGRKLQKLMFPYEWLDNCKKLNHVGPARSKDFYSRLKTIIAKHKYEQFLKMFRKNDCTTMGADVVVNENNFIDPVAMVP